MYISKVFNFIYFSINCNKIQLSVVATCSSKSASNFFVIEWGIYKSFCRRNYTYPKGGGNAILVINEEISTSYFTINPLKNHHIFKTKKCKITAE